MATVGTELDIEEQLRRAIVGAAVSRYRLAALSGVSQASLSLFVSGKRTLTLESAAKLAAVLGLVLRPAEADNGQGKARR